MVVSLVRYNFETVDVLSGWNLTRLEQLIKTSTFDDRDAKGFCFVEYDAPEAAVAALGVLNGVMLGAPRARGRGGRQGTPGAPGRGRTQGC